MTIPANTPLKQPSARLSRREFLLFAGGSLLLAACGDGLRGRRPRVGLALGGGGAKGLAHILMLEALDELGIRPHRVAGTSIGAVVGALYAGGLSATQIRALIEQFLVNRVEADRKLFALPASLRWLDFIDPAFGSGGLLDSSDFIAFLGETIHASRFSDLEIPLKVVAAELWSGAPVVLDSGPLLSAVQASMAVPGVFPPVERDGLKLVDGGVANPLPFDLLSDECDLVIAIDVSGDYQPEDGEELSSMGVVFHSFQIMSQNILAEKLRYRHPDIYIKPELKNVRMLEFYKAREVFDGALPAKQQLTRALKNVRGLTKPHPGCSIRTQQR
ncbi:MAG: patatin-like phospholipase family protein [Gammaproteobacteria bacterium]|nr:patatin-like phospholipase family protein [Gammaproteobacteria bacterium]MDH3560793.1 patatin-like phospholipase family protein [Gammaproteobacteria bacterium]